MTTTSAPVLHAPPIGTRATTTEPPRWRRLVRGRPEDPSWVRPTLWALLAVTAVLNLWSLGESGWANSFYAAAVQAGSESWKAFFFGSSDAANSITVDKTPASLWIMSFSARIFGMNAWSMLVPQALEGVATVGLLYLAVRRWASPAAGLLAGAVLALTPVATLMFRFNNPDALLTLALVGAAYCVVRATEVASTKWLMAGRCADRPRLPHQDAAGVPAVAGARAGLPRRRPHLGAPPDRAAAARRSRGAGLGRLVGGDRGALAEVQPPVHRRIAEQQRAGAGPGLQRARPADRQRDRQRHRRRRPGRQRRRHVGRDRLEPDVRRRDRRPDQLAHSGRADPAGGDALVRPPRAAHRPDPRVAAALGRLAAASPASSSATCRASSTRTTRSRSRRPSVRWSVSARSSCGAGGRAASPGPCWPSRWPPPRRGPMSCSDGRPTGCRGCAGRSWPVRRSPCSGCCWPDGSPGG